MPNNWVKIYSSSKLHVAELVRAVLDDHGIKTAEINKTDSMHTHLTNGAIEIYVDPDDAMKAKHLISKHEL